MNRAVLASLIILCLLSVSSITGLIQTIKADAAPIYINTDGSISPSNAPIYTADNITYSLTGNITANADGIVIERNNTVLNGAGYTVTGSRSENGITLENMGNVTINNIAIDNFVTGILLSSSSNNIMSANKVTNNLAEGIWLESSNNNTLSGNNVANSLYGIYFSSSSGNTLSGNNVANNAYGIWLEYSSNTTLSGNVMVGNGHNFEVDSDYVQSVDTSNLVDGKPVYYFVNQSDIVVNAEGYPEVGYLGFVNCDNVTVQGLNLTNNGQGLLLAFTNNSKITGNNVTNNDLGIYSYSSFDNVLSGNNVTANSGDGIELLSSSDNNTLSGNNVANNGLGIGVESSSNNVLSDNNVTTNNEDGIYLGISFGNTLSGNNVANNANGIFLYASSDNALSGNNVANNANGIWLHYYSSNNVSYHNFMNNTHQVIVDSPSQVDSWDDGYPSGGNYWSDYNGTDLYVGPYQNETGSDGIGDVPYVIDSFNKDSYPLMNRYLSAVNQTIYIQTDGSVVPITAPIQRIGDIYRLTGSICVNADGVVIERDNVTLDGAGYTLQGSENGVSCGVTVDATNITIQNLNIETFEDGIRGIGSFYGNNINNCSRGIVLQYGGHNTLVGNTFQYDGLYIPEESSDFQNVVENNTVNNKPLAYLEGASDITVENAGQVVLVNCNNMTVKNLDLSNATVGAAFFNTTNSIISECTLTGNTQWSILLDMFSVAWSANDTVIENLIAANKEGVEGGASGCNLIQNNITDNGEGVIWWGPSYGDLISGNRIAANAHNGLIMYEGNNNNSVCGNIFEDNDIGLSAFVSNNENITGNIFNNDGLDAFESYNNTVTRNTVNGKPLTYLEGVSDGTVGDSGQVILVRCNNMTVRNQNLSNTFFGLEMVGTNNTLVEDNRITGNKGGIEFVYSFNNSVLENDITDNLGGFLFDTSSGNTICHNNLINNTDQVQYDYVGNKPLMGDNFWDDGYPSGGNYWSDNNGTDLYSGRYQNETGSDGLGDSPYLIDANNADRYPLMAPYGVSSFVVNLSGSTGPISVGVMSNSTVSNVQVDEVARTLSFNVSGEPGTAGFCRITLPNIIVESLWNGNYTVLMNGEPCPFTSSSDNENTYIYINYTHSEHQITIIPELPYPLALLPLMMAMLFVVVVNRRRRSAESARVENGRVSVSYTA